METSPLSTLQEFEARFRAAFQSSAIGMGLLTLEGRILQVNEAVVKMSGYSREELYERYDAQNVFPEDREVGMDLFQELLDGKRDSYQVEKRYVRKNGEVFWTRLTLSAVRNPDNSPAYLVGMIEDIDQQKRTLAELKESEGRFRAIFENSAIGMSLIGLDRQPLEVNPAISRLSGYSREEFIRKRVEEISHPEDVEVGNREFQELLSGKRDSYQIEKRFLRKEGGYYWARLTISGVRGPDGELQNIVSITQDITEQKKAQRGLQVSEASRRESEARFRVMFENAGIGIALVGMDRRPLEANAALIQMTGYTPEEFFQKTGFDLSYAEDADIGIPELQDVLEGELNTYQIEKRYIRKNGQVYWVRLTNSAVRGADGKPQYFVTMVEDIDEQKRMQERVRESEARFRAMYDNAAVGMAIMSLDRRILSINQVSARMTGYSAEELAGMDPSQLSHPEDIEIGMEEYRDMVAGTIPGFQMQKRFLRKDGTVFWGRVTYSVVPDKEGRPEYLVGFIEDATEEIVSRNKLAVQEAEYRRTLEQRVEERTRELEESNEQLQKEIEQRVRIEKELAQKAAEEAVTADRTRLARDLHDAVTQTLFSASLTAEVLPELWEMDVDEAKRSTEELRQLARGALAEMRTLLLELRPAALTQSRLSDLIKQLCEAFIGRSRLPITLTIEGERDLPPEVQIACYRVAQEGLNNVFKYARASKVDVNLFLSAAGVRFEVCDNGIGFDMTASKPTSLGMRIMRERAEAIGAELSVSSAPGQGTCVELIWNENPSHKLRVL
jgi:PAS domain S-box-containing protein